MKFLLKITLFLALILISKLTKESEGVTSTAPETKPTIPALTSYNQQDDVPGEPEKVEEKKSLTIYH